LFCQCDLFEQQNTRAKLIAEESTSDERQMHSKIGSTIRPKADDQNLMQHRQPAAMTIQTYRGVSVAF